MWVVCDIETNGIENPSRLWCIVCKDIDTGKVYTFEEPDLNPSEFQSFAQDVEVWIGHFFLGFDYLQINRLTPVTIDPASVIDTLVVSRLANYCSWNDEEKPVTLEHSLEAWGERFNYPKLHTDISFDIYTPQLLERCIGDVELTHKILLHYWDYIFDERNQEALQIEHESQLHCNDIKSNGFCFDISRATDILSDINSRLHILSDDLLRVFPPKSVLVKEITPKATKHGTISKTDFRWVEDGDLTPYNCGWSFSRFEWKHFNPGSPKDRIEALNSAGWKPYDKTDGHIEWEKKHKKNPTEETKAKLEHFKTYGWTCSEDNLATLPKDAPEAARKLVQWLLLRGRQLKLEEWFRAYNPTTGRIHGTYIPIGAWTQRKAHAAPNQANTPSKDSKYNSPDLKALAKEFGIKLRECFHVPPKRLLIGTDADGIQSRIFAHYINDREFIQRLTEGRSEDGTDIHTKHFKTLQPACGSRADAKTFYYAWILGAGVGKVANIFGCSETEARNAIKIFLDIYPGLVYLKKEIIPSDARRGYFIGFDGRIVTCPSEYLMLAGYLQNGESVIMKHAQSLWRKRLTQERIWFKMVNDVHDEWQTEIEDNRELAEYIGKVQADSIRTVGEYFNLNCPFKGNYKIGTNWNETH